MGGENRQCTRCKVSKKKNLKIFMPLRWNSYKPGSICRECYKPQKAKIAETGQRDCHFPSKLLKMEPTKLEDMIADRHILLEDGGKPRTAIIVKGRICFSNPVRDTYYPAWRIIGTFQPDVEWEVFLKACLDKIKEWGERDERTG